MPIIIGVALFLFLIPTHALAQTTQPITPNSQPPTNYNTPNFNPEVPRNQHTFTQSAIIELASSVFCIITGIDPIVPEQGCLDIDTKTHKLGLRQPQKGEPQVGGLIGFFPGIFSIVYTPPASSMQYFRYLASSFGLTEPAYAASGGFEALAPILPLWIAARNMAYLLFVLVFLIIGLAVMLRVKIDPRTVMTLQNQIPRIIVGILLVTFSYAIAGLMIDGMWLLTYAGINTITQADKNGGTDSVTNPVIKGYVTECAANGKTLQQRATVNLLSTPFNYADQVFKQGCNGTDGIVRTTEMISWNIAPVIRSVVNGILAPTGTSLGTEIIAGLAAGGIGAIVLPLIHLGVYAAVWALLPILALIIIYIALMWNLLLIWFELLKAYVMLILYIIGAPLWIVTGLLPGRPLGFDKWFRRMFVHLAVFPAVACLLTIAAVLMNVFNNVGDTGAFVPPLIGQPNATGFGSLLAFSIILMGPSLLEVLKENLHAASKGGAIANKSVMGGIAIGAALPKGLGKAALSNAMYVDPYSRTAKGPLATWAMGKPGTWQRKYLAPIMTNIYHVDANPHDKATDEAAKH